MEPDKQAGYSIGDADWVRINMGPTTLDELRNIVRELKYLWRYLDNMTPKAEVRATQSTTGQYTLHLNGRALFYLLIFAKDIPAFDASKIEQATASVPADFLG